MKTKWDKTRFIQALRKAPFISYACKVAGMGRETAYRLMRSDKEFRDAVREAQSFGREDMEDICEMGLIKKIRENDSRSIEYYLSHNSKRYAPKYPIRVVQPPTEPKPANTCERCGREKVIQKDKEKMKVLAKMLMLYKDKYGHYPEEFVGPDPIRRPNSP